ncbi:Hsp20/alpha crystallin family protein [Oxalobacteraceae bacterium CAVE-383]|nr:Hsp20/alpha crystallin family protein [Oxalobacteraceae bacterium CAVE-383]
MYRALFPRNVFAELDSLQRELQQAFDFSPSIRGLSRGAFPAINVGRTDQTLEIYSFAPGLDPSTVNVEVERDILTIAGERKSDLPEKDKDTNVHIQERFSGRFRRVITLPEDANPESVAANYRDGVLHVTVQRRAAAQPRRINLQ